MRVEGTIGLSCYGLAPHEVVPVAMRVEEAGFDGLWLGEHVVTPTSFETEHPYPSHLHVVPIIGGHTELVDMFSSFGAMAAATSRIYLGTGICILPLRHPLLTAQATVTLQRIAGGRLLFGGGTGWFLEEFQALQSEFSTRGARMNEIVEILKRAWAGGAFAFHGEHYRFESLVVTPSAIEIPLVLGGGTERALRRVARWADGWRNPSSTTFEECSRIRERLHEMLGANGRSPDSFQFHISMLDTTAETVERYRDAGFVHLSVPTFALWRQEEPVPLERKLETIDELAAGLGLERR